VAFHYYRKDGLYDKWALWLWSYPNGNGAEYVHNSTDSFGAVFTYSLSLWSTTPETLTLGFIVKSAGSWDSKDPDGDRTIAFSSLDKDSKDTYNVWLKSADSTVYTSEPSKVSIDSAKFTSYNTVDVKASDPVASYTLKKGETSLVSKVLDTPVASFTITLTEAADISSVYKVEVTFEGGETAERGVDTSAIYDTADFIANYAYSAGDLGATYSASATTFKVWSPISSAITLRLYVSGTPVAISATAGDDTHTDYPMSKGDKGVWSVTLTGDYAGQYYTYLVTNAYYTEQEIVDPYAKSCGVDGLRGMIVDFSKTNPTGWEDFSSALPIDRKSEVVYETHVADVTSSSTWGGSAANAKKFLGLTETGTTYSKDGTTVTTGFDHIKELGVNAVQLLPIFDQANDEVNPSFNWGYNPLNYNCLEGAYSSNPYDGYARIKEFKQVVQAYHEAGINIIMDVVYNHVNSVSNQNFDVLVPYYYFRYTSAGALSNGSGCGNETASNRIMFRNFMIDSTAFWLKEYKLGGFRFDLMGLHDIDTMNAVVANLQTINAKVTVYGEPWTGGTSTLNTTQQAIQVNGNKWVGFGGFNDHLRDPLIMGGMSGATDTGFVTKTTGKISNTQMGYLLNGIKGITSTSAVGLTIADPDKTTNYVTCHDNYTLADRFAATKLTYTAAQIEEMNVLANAVVLTSQGTSFMLAGEEFLRSKGGNSNSYNASYAVNELNYALKIAHPQMMSNYQKLISLKKNLDGLHLDKTGIASLTPSASADNSEITYTLNDTANARTYKVVHASGYGAAPAVDLAGYTLYLDTLNSGVSLSAATAIAPYQTLIAYKAA
jgi:pullulanase